jgi:hypothetical protein
MFRCLTLVACHALRLVLLAPLAEAGPYAYIDATPGNTTLNGAALVAGTNYINNGNSKGPIQRDSIQRD